jgi:site-specific DNA recombinase
MNAIIYIRVSTTEQAELGYSLKAQEETCIEYAKRNNIKVLKVFSEKGESAKTTNRTELKRLLEYIDIKSSEIDCLIVFKLDRLSRNLLDYANLVSLLTKYGITLKSATESISPTPEGTLMQNIIASFAQYDNDQRSQRTRSGMVQAVKEGRWVWKAPLGYSFTKKDGRSYLVPSDEKYIIEKIFNGFVRGKKQHEIIADLKDIGLVIPKQTLNKLLSNPVYIGKIKSAFFDIPVSGLQQPIIDEVVFYKTQDILAKKSSHCVSRNTIKDFPLRQFLRCPQCHSKLTGSWSKGRHKKYPYYHCTKKGCRFKPIRIEKAEELFINYLRLFEPADKVLDKFIEASKEFAYKRYISNHKIITSISKDIEELELRKAKIEDLAIEGTFSKERFIKKINDVEKQISFKTEELKNADKENINMEALLSYFRTFIKNLSGLWNYSKLDQKIKLQYYLFPEGIIIQNNILRTTRINPILKALEEYKDQVINSLSGMVAHRGLEPLF